MTATLFLAFLVATTLVAAPAAAQLASADRDFLVQDAQGAAYELELAKLAVDRASREDVKAYARRLVADHDGYNAALQALGREKGVTLPTDLTTASTVKLTALKALSGALFDKAFIEEAARVNADDVQEADRERKGTRDEAIKAFLAKFTAMDAEHASLARTLSEAK